MQLQLLLRRQSPPSTSVPLPATCTSLLQQSPKRIIALRFPLLLLSKQLLTRYISPLANNSLFYLPRCPGDKIVQLINRMLRNKTTIKFTKLSKIGVYNFVARSITNHQNGNHFHRRICNCKTQGNSTGN